ncbi:murein transglycosylase [Alsobacter metallidurans]|uniref:Murein transglycosylase n=1 Tax=Alsobacter metallidurans TaxID=340221 RepID=A0A917I7P7_9HYPH|nr:lytic murein transglycosylase [Alsobacter metallidurans]GGH23266.1 murein transglycosylase [Alsobacter metallidurans]
MAWNRRQLLSATLAFAAAPALAQNGGAQPDFEAHLARLAAKAQSAGVPREVAEAALRGIAPDASLMGRSTRQPEFSRPLQDYVAEAASAGRARRGRELASRWSAPLAAAEAASGAPGSVILALWALETDFGREMGSRDVLRSLCTLAYARPENGAFADEVVAALIMVRNGVPREKLRGSWAGAMGNPQFLPSAYLKYATSPEGRPNPDIWSSVPDSVASIGAFLKGSGWRAGVPAAVEVRMPAGYDIAALRQDSRAWTVAGFQALDGTELPASGEAMLFLPSGARGPAFLLYANFWVLKVYNFSDSYAMAASILADRIAGGPGVRQPWPKNEMLLGQADRERLQRALLALGHYRGAVDGRFGPVTREAIHAFQRQIGYRPSDGYPSAEILARAAAASGT